MVACGTPSSSAWSRAGRPDDDGKDAERGEAADGEPSDGRRGYIVQRRRQGQRL